MKNSPPKCKGKIGKITRDNRICFPQFRDRKPDPPPERNCISIETFAKGSIDFLFPNSSPTSPNTPTSIGAIGHFHEHIQNHLCRFFSRKTLQDEFYIPGRPRAHLLITVNGHP